MTRQHGTLYGFTQHMRLREKPCDACRAARNVYRREWRRTRRLLGLEAS